MPWRFFAGYTRRYQSSDHDPSTGAVFERLADGPVSMIAAMSAASITSVHQWSVGGRLGETTPSSGRRHALEAGIEASGGGEGHGALRGGRAELVNTLPARLWRFSRSGIDSFRHKLGVGACGGKS